MPGKIPEQILKELIQQDLEDNLVTDLPAFTETRPYLTFQLFFFLITAIPINNILLCEEEFAGFQL